MSDTLAVLIVHAVIGAVVIGALAALAALGTISGVVAVGGILTVSGVLLGTGSSAVGAANSSVPPVVPPTNTPTLPS